MLAAIIGITIGVVISIAFMGFVGLASHRLLECLFPTRCRDERKP